MKKIKLVAFSLTLVGLASCGKVEKSEQPAAVASPPKAEAPNAETAIEETSAKLPAEIPTPPAPPAPPTVPAPEPELPTPAPEAPAEEAPAPDAPAEGTATQ